MSRSQLHRPDPPHGRSPATTPAAPCCTSTWTRSTPRSSLLERPELRGHAGDRRRRRTRGVVLSATYEARAFGVALGDADDAGPPAVPAGGRRRRRTTPAYAAGVGRRHGGLPRGHPAGRAALPGRGVPRRRRGGPAARLAGGDRRADPRAGCRRAGHHLLGRRGGDEVRRQARLDQGQAGRPAGRPARPGVVEFLHPLPVGALWGVGERTEEELHPARACARSATSPQTPAATLERALGAAAGRAPARPGLGPRRRAGRPARAGQSDRRRGDVRHATSTTRRWSGASCCGCPSGSARAAAPAGLPAAAPSRSRCGSPTSRRSPGPGRCASPPTSPARSTRRRCGLYEALGLDRARIRLVGVRVEGLVDADAARRAAAARRAGARLAGGRAGRRPGGPTVRARRRPARRAWSGRTDDDPSRPGDPGPATRPVVNRCGPGQAVHPGGRRTGDPDVSYSRVSPWTDACLCWIRVVILGLI